MDKQKALDLIKQVIDLAVQRGLFIKSDDVVTVHAAFDELSKKDE